MKAEPLEMRPRGKDSCWLHRGRAGRGLCSVSMKVQSEGVCARTEGQGALVAGGRGGVGMRERGRDHP